MHKIDSKLNIVDYFKLVLKGFCMGIVEVIPGISGGTLAFLLGIYGNLILAIESFNIKFLKTICKFKIKEAFDLIAWRFLFAIGLGSVLAIIIFSKVISFLLENHPVLIYAFFFGLILATGPIIGKIVKKWSLQKVFIFIIGAIITYYFVGMVPATTPDNLFFVFLCGAIVISAWILPGVSGSFLLVLLGKYHFILNAVNDRNIIVLLVFISGLCIGIVLFVRLIKYLLAKFHDWTLVIITSIVIGSLNKIWPWKKTIRTIEGNHGKIIPIEQINIFPDFDQQLGFALMLMVLGFFLAFSLDRSNSSKLK